MDSLPGGGAEIFSERVRRIICDHKIDGNEWIETARTAHQLGLQSNCTMLYGHIETDEDRVDHLVRLRELQDETRRLRHLHPARVPSRTTRRCSTSRAPPGFDDLKNIAVVAADARQHPAHQGVLGDDDAADRADRASASAPTTSTARWSRRRSTTTPAPPRRNRCAAANCCG